MKQNSSYKQFSATLIALAVVFIMVFSISFVSAFELTDPSTWDDKVEFHEESTNGKYGYYEITDTLFWVFNKKQIKTVELLENDYSVFKAWNIKQIEIFKPTNLFDRTDYYDKTQKIDKKHLLKSEIHLYRKLENKTKTVRNISCSNYETVTNQSNSTSYKVCTEWIDNSYEEEYEDWGEWETYNFGVVQKGIYQTKTIVTRENQNTGPMDWVDTSEGHKLKRWYIWWDSSWDYNKEYTNLTGNIIYMYFNKSVNDNADFNDTRFISCYNDSLVFNHTLEAKFGTYVQMRVNNLGENCIKRYYGNSEATSTSNASDVYFEPISAYYFDANANDFVGSNHGTVTGATLTSGYINGSYSFDGSSNYISVSNVYSSSSQTISMWIRKEGGNGVRMSLIEGDHSTDWTQSLEIDTTNKIRTWAYVSGGVNIYSTTTPSLNTWYHIASVFDDANDILRIYVNGIEENNISAVGTKTYTTNTVIGTYRVKDGRWWDGKIDEVLIYDKALTPTQINQLYTQTAPNFIEGNEEVPAPTPSLEIAWYGFSDKSILTYSEIVALSNYDYSLFELEENMTNTQSNFQNILDSINDSRELNIKSGLNFVLDFDYNDSALKNQYLTDISENFSTFNTVPYSDSIVYISLELKDQENFNDTTKYTLLNDFAEEIAGETGSSFPIYSKNYNNSNLDSSYISYTELLYLTSSNEANFIEDQKYLFKNNQSLNRIYVNIPDNIKTLGQDFHNRIIDSLRSNPNPGSLTNIDASSLNNKDVLIFNNGSSPANFTINVSALSVSGKDVWDSVEGIYIEENTDRVITVEVKGYNATIIYFEDLDHIQMDSLDEGTLYKGGVQEVKSSNHTDGIKDGSFSFAGAKDLQIELYDPHYNQANFITYYGWLNTSSIASPKGWENYEVVILSDQNNAELDALNYAVTDFYGYISVADYNNTQEWTDAKMVEVDDWLALNESLNIFVDGMDSGTGGENFSSRMKDLIDYIQITKARKGILNTYTAYEDFATWGNGGVMKESCVNRWNGDSPSPPDNYTRENWTLELERSQWFMAHGVDVYCQAFDNRTSDGTYTISNYTELQNIYFASKVLGYEYFYLSQPDFQYTHEEWVYDVGESFDRSAHQLSIDENTYYRTYENGVVYYNTTSGQGWIDDGLVVNEMQVCFYLYRDYLTNPLWSFNINNRMPTGNTGEYSFTPNLSSYTWGWQCADVTDERPINGRYLIEAWAGDHTVIAGQGYSVGWSDYLDSGQHSWYDLNTYDSFIAYPQDQNWMINMTIDITKKISIDTTDKINQYETSGTNVKNITMNSSYAFPIEIWSNPTTFNNFEKVKFLNSTGSWIVLNYNNNTNCDSGNPTWNTTLIEGETYKACIKDGDSGTIIRVAVPNLGEKIFQIDARIPPQITVESPIGTLGHNYIGGNESLNVTFNDSSLDSCWYNYNGTNITIDGCLSGIGNSTTFILEEGNFNMTIYANDSFGSLNSSFINWSYTYLENNRTYNTQSYETQTESFNINVEGPTSVSLFYNGTEYTTTKSGNNFNRTIQIPISQVGNNSIYWRFNDAVNSYTSYQNVSETVFTLCNATYSTVFLNASFKDEADSSTINASIPTSTFDYWLGDGTVKKTYNYVNSADNYNYEFCSTPNLELNTDMYIQYKQGSNYPQRIYNAEATALTNTTTNLILYLLGVSDGLYVTFQVFGGQSNALQGVDVTGTRVISSSTTAVAQGTTDAAGTVTFWLNPDFLHTLTFIKIGYETVIETITPTQTLYTITMGGEAAAGVTNYAEGVIITTLPQGSFLDTNTFYTFTYTIDSSILSLDEYGFELFYNNGTSIYSDTDTTSTGGTLDKSFNVTNESRIEMTYYYITNGTRINGTTYWLIYQTNDFSLYHFFDRVSTYIDYNIYGIQGDDEGYFAKAMISILILILVTGTLSMRYGLASDAAVTGLLFGVIFMLNVFNLIPTPDFLTFINLGDFLVFLIALIGIVTIIKEEGR